MASETTEHTEIDYVKTKRREPGQIISATRTSSIPKTPNI